MESNYNEQKAYSKAKKRVENLKGFYWSIFSYCMVIPFLVYINYTTYWGFQWFWFPALGWLMGILFQGFYVFGPGEKWEDRKIKEFMEQERREGYN